PAHSFSYRFRRSHLSPLPQSCDELRGVPVARCDLRALFVEGPQGALNAATQTDGFFEHRVENCREVAGRGVDDTEHLGNGGLSGERFVALCGPLSELAPRIIVLSTSC